MNYTIKNDFFGFPKVKWLHLTGEMDKSVTFLVKFSQDLTWHCLPDVTGYVYDIVDSVFGHFCIFAIYTVLCL